MTETRTVPSRMVPAILAVLLCVAAFSGVAAGDHLTDLSSLSGSGTSADPYQITDVHELQAMENDLSAHYELTGDIDASATSSWNSGAGFDPIGNSSNPFTGTFDGGGHTISDLYIDRSSSDIGLFGMVGAGFRAQDILLKNASVTSTGNNVGAFVGRDDDTATHYTNVSATGVVSGSLAVGGVIGDLEEAYITKSHAGVDVTTDGQAGGYVGLIQAGGKVNQSYATGNMTVSGGSYVGGFVGYVDAGNLDPNDFEMNDTYATGNVAGGNQYQGGVIGYLNVDDTNHASIYDSYATGDVSADDDAGGFIGFTFKASGVPATIVFENVTASGDVSGNDKIGGLGGFLRATLTDTHATGDVIDTGGGGFDFGGLVGLALRTEINNSTATGNVTTSTGNTGGLVGRMEETKLDNVTASGIVDSGGGGVGGIVGEMDVELTDAGGKSHINDSASTGSVHGSANVGGFVGEVLRSGDGISNHIRRSYSTGDVTGTSNSVGGFVGDLSGGAETTIVQSAGFGDVTSTGDSVGGFVGAMSAGSINDSYTHSGVNGSDKIGGFAGTVSGGTIGGVYATGPIDASGNNVSASIGRDSGGSYESVYWDSVKITETSTIGTGLSQSEMTGTVASSNMDFDFVTTWETTDTYPVLQSLGDVGPTPAIQTTSSSSPGEDTLDTGAMVVPEGNETIKDEKSRIVGRGSYLQTGTFHFGGETEPACVGYRYYDPDERTTMVGYKFGVAGRTYSENKTFNPPIGYHEECVSASNEHLVTAGGNLSETPEFTLYLNDSAGQYRGTLLLGSNGSDIDTLGGDEGGMIGIPAGSGSGRPWWHWVGGILLGGLALRYIIRLSAG